MSPESPTDGQSAGLSDALLLRAVAGDEAAISAIWTHWNPRLLRFFQSRRINEPHDLAATVWLEIAGKLPEFKGNLPAFRRWLFTVAHRRMFDAARKAARTPTMVGLDSYPPRRAAAPPPVLEDLDWALGLLQRLPADQSTAVALRILAEMDVIDVAEVMRKSPTNVRVLTHRGLRRLAQLIENPNYSKPSVTPTSVGTLTPSE